MRARRAVLWCAGAVEPSFFDDLPTERTRYVSLGFALLIPPILALVGMGFTVYSLSGAWRWGLPAGLTWAAIVFIVDRGLVLTIKGSVPAVGWRHHVHSTSRVIWAVVVRLSLATLFGAIISHMVLLLVFRPEIAEQLAQETRAKTSEATKSETDELAALRTEEIALRTRYQTLVDDRAALEVERAKENAGTGLSREKGPGPVWEDLNHAITAKQRDVVAAMNHLRNAERRTQNAANGFATARSSARREIATGYMARARALEALTDGSAELRRNQLVLFAFFVVVELIPVLMKAMMLRGPYATRVAMQEWVAIEDERVRLESLNANHSTRVAAADARALRDAVSGIGGAPGPQEAV
jgi:hypothetical protein